MLPTLHKLVVQIEFDNSLSPYRTRNQIDPYHKRFIAIKNSVVSALRQFIPVQVVPKQPPPYYNRLSNRLDPTLYFDIRHGRNVHFPRKDSFQISIDNFLIFSRLKTGEWPSAALVTDWALKVASKLKIMNGDNSQTFAKQQFSSPNAKNQNNNFSLPPLSISTGQQYEQPRQTADRNRADLQQTPYSRQLGLGYDPPLHPRNNSRYQYDRRSLQNKSLDRFISHEVSSHKSKRGAYASKLMNNQIQKRSRFNSLYQTINMAEVRDKTRKQAFTWHFNSPAISHDAIKSKLSQNNLDESMRRNNMEPEPLASETPKQAEIASGAAANEEVREQEQKEQEVLPKVSLKLSESVLNCYRDSYEIMGDKIVKKYNEETWAPLLTENQLPSQGRYYFVVSVLQSKLNMIQIGIVPLDYYPKNQSHDQTQTFLCLNCSNGMIKDSREENAESTKWRLGGQAAPRDQPFSIKVVMDMQKHLIEWRIKDNSIGSARIPKTFKAAGCKMFISLYDVSDTVIFNGEQQLKKSEHSIDSPDVSLIAHSQKNDSNVLPLESEPLNFQRMLQSPCLQEPIQKIKEGEETKIDRKDVEIQTEVKGGKIIKQHLAYPDEFEQSREQRKWNKNRDFLKETVTFQKQEGLKWEASYAAQISQYQLKGISLELLRPKQPQVEKVEQPIVPPPPPEVQTPPAKVPDQFDYHWSTVYEHSLYKLREVKS